MKLGFIGLGNMATAIIGGVIGSGLVEAKDIIGSDVSKKAREAAGERFGITVTDDNLEVAKKSETVLLAVKPQFMQEALEKMLWEDMHKTLFITIAAGKRLEWYEGILGTEAKIVRCMPNTPALVGAGVTGVCKNSNVPDAEFEYALKLVGSFSEAIPVTEHLIDAVCGVSGSSPAFVFMFIEAMADAGVRSGLPRDKAYRFAAQTVYGSAKLMLESGKHPGELKDMVTSPGGTTIEGVRTLENLGFRAAVMEAVISAVERSKEL